MVKIYVLLIWTAECYQYFYFCEEFKIDFVSKMELLEFYIVAHVGYFFVALCYHRIGVVNLKGLKMRTEESECNSINSKIPLGGCEIEIDVWISAAVCAVSIGLFAIFVRTIVQRRVCEHFTIYKVVVRGTCPYWKPANQNRLLLIFEGYGLSAIHVRNWYSDVPSRIKARFTFNTEIWQQCQRRRYLTPFGDTRSKIVIHSIQKLHVELILVNVQWSFVKLFIKYFILYRNFHNEVPFFSKIKIRNFYHKCK